MQVKARQQNGFRPVTVKIKFDNKVEYEIFRLIMKLPTTIASLISTDGVGIIKESTGVLMKPIDVINCVYGVMARISNKLPDTRKK